MFEKKSLAYVIAIMNLILHGLEAPNIVHTNTLAEKQNQSAQRRRPRRVRGAAKDLCRLAEELDPNGGEEIAHRTPQAILSEIAALEAESAEVLEKVAALLK